MSTISLIASQFIGSNDVLYLLQDLVNDRHRLGSPSGKAPPSLEPAGPGAQVCAARKPHGSLYGFMLQTQVGEEQSNPVRDFTQHLIRMARWTRRDRGWSG